MASRDPNDLHPDLLPLYENFMNESDDQGIDVLVTCTYRSNEEQNALYAQGRTTPGRIVTNCRGGKSAHNFMLDGEPASKAFDVVPLVNGKPQWDAADPLWQQLGEIGVSLGLDWGGNWTGSLVEFPHFQLREI